ncbi:hypothetical protein L1887_54423 [Cichorium endivia]|nr:hypothetical protein L1887_54423 [Cichorium endivia]
MTPMNVSTHASRQIRPRSDSLQVAVMALFAPLSRSPSRSPTLSARRTHSQTRLWRTWSLRIWNLRHQLKSAPGCFETYVPMPDETCGELASDYGIYLSSFEADYAADSDFCETMLSGQGYCASKEGDGYDGDFVITSVVYADANNVQVETFALNNAVGTGTGSVGTVGTVTNHPFANATGASVSTVTVHDTQTTTVLTTSTQLANASSTLTAPRTLKGTPFATTRPAPAATLNAENTYKSYLGNGTVAEGWPSEDQWLSFDNLPGGGLFDSRVHSGRRQLDRAWTAASSSRQ